VTGGKYDREVLIPVVVKIVAPKTVAIGSVVSRLVLEVELDRIETNDHEGGTAFVAGDVVTLFRFGVNENFFAAFGANRCWHFLLLSENLFVICISRNDRVKIGLIFNLT
jgi:hypothetical protein